MKIRLALSVAVVFGLASIGNAQTFLAKGKDYGADTSYAVVPATSSRPTIELLSLFTDKDAPTLKFYSSGAAITLPAGEGTGGTCTVVNADYTLTNGDIVVSFDSTLGTYERHSIADAGSNYVLLSPAPTGTLVSNDVVYEATLDVSLTLSAAYQLAATNGQYARIPHRILNGGPYYVGRPSRPILIDFVGTTNAGTGACNLDFVSGTRN